MSQATQVIGQQIDQRQDAETIREFGGPFGVTFFILFSHFILYYLWMAWRFHGGALFYPTHLSTIPSFFDEFFHNIVTYAAPSWYAVSIYLAFIGLQALFSAFLPGIKIKGLPIPSQNNQRLDYNCNGSWAWYATLIIALLLQLTGVFSLSTLFKQFGPLMTVAIIASNSIAVLTYVGAKLTHNTHRMSGNFIYDFFMGAWLNPRLGRLDLKMWSEIRISWMLLFFLTLSAAVHQFETYHMMTAPMLFMVLAHGLYTNACMKGEECIPTTWDIFYEKWGWMLIFWNLAGVPFLYCFNSMYISSHAPFIHSTIYTVLCFVLLLGAYYVWDTSQSQRNRFRMQQRGTFVKRKAFPQLPWGTLKDPEYIQTRHGNKLLVDGWWRYARKIHYTADIMMGLSWGLICGFHNFLPYFYVAFFVPMILHRARRDIVKCREKYQDDWQAYTQKVPKIFIPYVI